MQLASERQEARERGRERGVGRGEVIIGKGVQGEEDGQIPFSLVYR